MEDAGGSQARFVARRCKDKGLNCRKTSYQSIFGLTNGRRCGRRSLDSNLVIADFAVNGLGRTTGSSPGTACRMEIKLGETIWKIKR